MVFFDVGAHYGYYTVFASRMVGDEGAVHSFEPTPSSFEILHSNTKALANVYLVNEAVWSEVTTIALADYGERFSCYNSLSQPRLQGLQWPRLVKNARTYPVRTTTLDHYVDQSQVVPDFVKVDVENAEEEVLSGMQKTLARARPIVSLEVGDMDMGAASRSQALVRWMMDKGYKAFEAAEGRIVEHRLRDRYPYGNLLFMPQDVR